MADTFYTWEHDDGRVAVAVAPAAFAEGDPAWHRGAPCEVHLPAAAASQTGEPAIDRAADQLSTLLALCRTSSRALNHIEDQLCVPPGAGFGAELYDVILIVDHVCDRLQSMQEILDAARRQHG